MADTKISALTAATTPLAGTEVLPIVQSGVNKQVSVADLTAGRAVSAASLALTTALTAANGGTGQSSYAVGDLLYASGTTTLSKLADVATGNALISGGVGVAPSWGKIGLTTHVSGTLPAANGGTGITSLTTGQVLFGSFSQSSNFFWDSSNNRLGLGTSSPGRLLELYTAGSPVLRWNDSTNTWDIRTNGSVGSAMQFDYNGARFFTLLSGGDFQNNTGNYVPATAAKGINFTANTGAAGKTSQLLNWYEEGTWTPTITAGSGTFTTVSSISGVYTRIGRQVTIQGTFTMTDKGTGVTALLSGLPFNPDGTNRYQGCFTDVTNAYAGIVYGRPTNSFWLYKYDGTDGLVNGHQYAFEVTYFT